MSYTHHQNITIEDREILCSGLISAIISLPPEQWVGSLDALAQPILTCLSVVTKEADQLKSDSADAVDPLMNRISTEVRLLASVVKCFIESNVSKNFSGDQRARISSCHRNALVSLLHRSWPILTHIATKYCAREVSRWPDTI